MGRREHQTSRASGSAQAHPKGTPFPETGPEGHWRYFRHLDRLDAISVDPDAGPAEEAGAVAVVLRDPDPVMAESAVVTHLDRRAVRLAPGAEFAAWARALGPVLDGREFPARRLHEWTLLHAIGGGAGWSPADLTAASDWCQRTAAHTLADLGALTLLAGSARTHRVRQTAAQRLRRAAV
ncbi:hypothetical protein ACIOD1_11465 [Streptomyces sp. NPDC088097]|uniref:hypothetical protein n=1 Tax=Streptomyces sp. NPDC088097 TaxID=3365823 RepID=UPI00382FBC70